MTHTYDDGSTVSGPWWAVLGQRLIDTILDRGVSALSGAAEWLDAHLTFKEKA